LKEKQQKPAPKLIQFQFITPVIIEDIFMFTDSNDEQVMNCEFLDNLKYW